MILAEMSLQMITTFKFWLSHHPWLFSILLCWDYDSYPSGLFSCDSLVDHSFEMTMGSSSRACQVRGVLLIGTHHQVSWFSQMGCETIFIVGLTVPTHQRNIFWDAWSFFQTLPMDWELWWHVTLRHNSPLSFPRRLAFKAAIFYQLRRSESSFTVWRSKPPSPYNSAFRAIIASQLWSSRPYLLQFWHSEPRLHLGI